jgi:hypothetical protein
MNTLVLATSDGDVKIREDELSFIADSELADLRISRANLHRCFAEGVLPMRWRKPAERVRPVASAKLDGTWGGPPRALFTRVIRNEF